MDVGRRTSDVGRRTLPFWGFSDDTPFSVQVQKGEVLGKLEAEEDPVVSFTVENVSSSKEDDSLAATCHKSGLVRLWTWTPVDEGKRELKTEVILLGKKEAKHEKNNHFKVTRTFRSIHTGPISLCRLHRLASGGKLLATGGTDGSVKVLS